MAMDPTLLDILACPSCVAEVTKEGDRRGELRHDTSAQTLTCLECSRIYEIRDGIPVLLVEEARQPEADHTAQSGPTESGTAPSATSG
ncbi:MAG: Trm112 family protein [Micromonosporaceae bacterium]